MNTILNYSGALVSNEFVISSPKVYMMEWGLDERRKYGFYFKLYWEGNVSIFI